MAVKILDRLKRLAQEFRPTSLKQRFNLSGKGPDSVQDTGQVTEATLERQKREILTRARSLVRPLVPSKHRAIVISLVIVTAFVIIFSSVFAVLIYRYQSDSPLVYQVARIIPYPAARINGDYVSYGDYLFELRPLKHFYSDPTGPAASVREPLDFNTPEGQEALTELERIAFEELREKAIVRQLAAAHDVSVSRQEVDEAANEAISREGGEEKFREVIKTYYNWQTADFQQALRAQLLKRKLLPVLSTDQRTRTEEILEQIHAGVDFATLASKHSADPGSSEQGGDLGLAPRGTYVKEFEEAAYALEPGEVSDIVASQHGFHIIKLLEKQDDQIRAAHILIQYADFDQVIAEHVAKAEVDTCFIWDQICVEIPSSPNGEESDPTST